MKKRTTAKSNKVKTPVVAEVKAPEVKTVETEKLVQAEKEPVVEKETTVAAEAEVAETEVAKTAKATKTAKTTKSTKTTTKKAVKEEMKPEVFIQYQGKEAIVEEAIEKAKAEFVADGHRVSSIKSLQIYLKPEEYAAYYVINQKFAGRVDLF